MSEVLSKNEIESLLSVVSSGKVPLEKLKGKVLKKTVIPYNFKRPSRISKDQIHSLELLHESFIHTFTVKLANYLRAVVELTLVAIDQITYAEFIASLSNPTYIVIVNIDPLPGQIILEIDPSVTFCVVDRLLGGSGKVLKETRELTNIEHSIMEKVTNLALNCLQQAWSRMFNLSFRIQAKESNPQFVQIAPPGETTLLITTQIKIGKALGVTNICIPYTTIEPLLPKLSSHEWASEPSKQSSEKIFKLIQKNLDEIKVTVIAQLGTAKINIRDFLQLEVGDVVRLEQKVNQDLIVKIENLPKFYGTPGSLGKQRAIQITSKIKGEENKNEK